MKSKKNTLIIQSLKKHPIATNILIIQAYNDSLKLSQILFFDWLVVKARSFEYKEFYYSFRRISEEIRVQKAALKKASAFFKDLGFYSYEVKGMPQTTYHSLNFQKLATRKVLSVIYKSDYVDEVRPFFQQEAKKVASKTKPPKKNRNTVTISQDIDSIITVLNEIYNERRIKMYNKGKLTNEIPNGILSETQLPINRQHKIQLTKLNQSYNLNAISNAFTAYTDSVLIKEKNPKNMMSLFLFFDENSQAFKVFEDFLNNFNIRYSKSTY